MAELSKDHLYALIICGGAGTRLWPRSRQATPKQFLEGFYGDKTLFQQTIERAQMVTDNQRIFIVTIADYIDETIKYAKEIMPRNIIAEPFGKNTAMAVGVGVTYIKKVDPEAVVIVIWSDAAVRNNQLFAETMTKAAEASLMGDFLVTIGIKPVFPHTGLGYIEVGEKFNDTSGQVFKVLSFKEKPDLPTAQSFLDQGNFYWNSGIIAGKAKTILSAYAKHSPEIFSLLEKIEMGIGKANEREIILDAYEKVEATPLEKAISEKADNMLLVPATFDWSDIGDWKVVYDLEEKDSCGNVIKILDNRGGHLGIETTDCLINPQDRLVATIGVSNLIIIETKDAILICHKDKAQEVKKIVNLLKEKGVQELL